MSSKITYIKAFNNYLFEFIDDIQKMFPENNDIAITNTFLKTIKSTNVSLIIKLWYSSIYVPYEKEIESGNMDFFFTKEYKEDFDNHAFSNIDEIMNAIDKLRTPFLQMSENKKNDARQYIQNLSKMSYLYHKSIM